MCRSNQAWYLSTSGTDVIPCRITLSATVTMTVDSTRELSSQVLGASRAWSDIF